MTICMSSECDKEATHRKRTEGFFYDDFRCSDHKSEHHKPVEEFV